MLGTIFRWRRSLVMAIYVSVLLVEIYFWPDCLEETYEYDDGELDLPPMPKDLLNPPMWNSRYPSGHCGKWPKLYTTIHRDILSGQRPPSYLVYTTGKGFPPIIEGVPQAMKGIATVFMIALLTDRAFILDWQLPPGLSTILQPRYIDWSSNALFSSGLPVKGVHDIGSPYWFDSQGKSVEWYMRTDFSKYFTEEIEIVQSHSYDFTYALLRNRYYKQKIFEYGLNKARCLLCCFWHQLFTFTPQFLQTTFNHLRRIGWSKSYDIIFINMPLPNHQYAKNYVLRLGESVIECAEKVASSGFKLKKPVWILASNSFVILDGTPKRHLQIKPEARFFSKERYAVDIERDNNTIGKSLKLPKTEQNALVHLAIAFFLQLNSSILVSNRHSVFSESMLAYRHFFYQSNRYVVYTEGSCQVQRFKVE